MEALSMLIILKSSEKPQKSLLVFENRELKDGSVYVNITPKSKQLFEDEE